jgi:hypothetical protein
LIKHIISQSNLAKLSEADYGKGDLSYQLNNKDDSRNNNSSYSDFPNTGDFMMKGHKFSSTYNNNLQGDHEKISHAPYTTQVHQIEKISIRGRESNPRQLDIIPALDQSRSSIHDPEFRAQSQTALKNANEAPISSLKKLQTSSWLFSKNKSKNTTHGRNQYYTPFTLDRQRKNKSNYSVNRRNLHRRIGK